MPTPKKTREQKLAKLTPEQEAEIQAISSRAIADFEGQLDELERAIGLLHMGHHFGWRTLVLIHSKRTIRKYESILGIVVREFFPAEGPSSYRSYGLKVASRLDNFWKAVSGETKIEGRKDIGKGDLQTPL
jgi:hypothetical protein